MSSPEIRFDPLTGLRTILAPGRAERPDAFEPVPPKSSPDAEERCPFCEGREDRTPPEIWSDREEGEADSPGWRVRAVPNLYPALDADAAAQARAARPGDDRAGRDHLGDAPRGSAPRLMASRPAAGVHEVIIQTPRHVTTVSHLEPAEIEAAIGAWRTRMAAHRDAAYVQLIVNDGPQAGASLEHSHAQLYALDFVPAVVARERERYATHHEQTMGSSLHDDILSEEIRIGERVVAVDDEAVLLCPWASPSPFSLRIVPRAAEPDFATGTGGAEMLRKGLRALANMFGRAPQLNLWVRTAPRGVDQFAWRIDIAPRLTTKAGFELSTGVDINVYSPERAAADLREALPE